MTTLETTSFQEPKTIRIQDFENENFNSIDEEIIEEPTISEEEPRFQTEIPTYKPEPEQLNSFQSSYFRVNQSMGLGGEWSLFGGQTKIKELAINEIANSIPEYKDNAKAFQSRSSASEIDIIRARQAIKNEVFALGENDDLIIGANGNPLAWALFPFLQDTIKTELMFQRNGITEQSFKDKYAEITERERKVIEQGEDGLIGNVAGTLAAYVFDPVTLFEIIASPNKIVGTSILKAAKNSFIVEAAVVGVGEFIRELSVIEHKEMLGKEYGLWDSVQSIGMAMGIAGTLRSLGSIFIDTRIMKKIDTKFEEQIARGVVTPLDKELFARWNRREEYRLTKNSFSNIWLMSKVQEDMDTGKKVDITEYTDIDIETITDPNIKAESFIEQQNISDVTRGIDVQLQQIDNSVEREAYPDDFYGGMATKEDGDNLIAEMADRLFDDEDVIELELLEKELKELDSAYQKEVEQMEADTGNPKGFQPKQMTIGTEAINKTDFDLIQARMKTSEWNRKNPDKKRTITERQESAYKRHVNIADELLDMDFQEGQTMPIFAQFADNLAVGAVAGIEEDEEGNITFNPEMFVAGLGGYTVAKQMFKKGYFDTLPQEVNAQVKKYFGVDLEPKIVEGNISTIDTQGTQRPTTNSLGNPIAKTEKEIGSFYDWFRKSKAVDDKGQPLVLYHGTSNPNIQEFRPSKRGQLGAGVYLTDDRRTAKKYTDYNIIYEMNAKIQNPLVVTSNAPAKEILKAIYGNDSLYNRREKAGVSFMDIIKTKDTELLKRKGYDGIVSDFNGEKEIIVFEADQIKIIKDTPPIEKSDKGAQGIQPETFDYRMDHSIQEQYSSSLDKYDEVMDEDIYSEMAWRYYGGGRDYEKMDKKSLSIIKRARANPDMEIEIFRAVPKGVNKINSGDWITISKEYAIEHGESYLDGNYVILSEKVKAKDIRTDGNDIHEQILIRPNKKETN